MDISAKPVESGFIPIELTLTMKSTDELITIFVLFNYTDLGRFIDGHCGEDTTKYIREALIDAFGGTLHYDKLHNELKEILQRRRT